MEAALRVPDHMLIIALRKDVDVATLVSFLDALEAGVRSQLFINLGIDVSVESVKLLVGSLQRGRVACHFIWVGGVEQGLQGALSLSMAFQMDALLPIAPLIKALHLNDRPMSDAEGIRWLLSMVDAIPKLRWVWRLQMLEQKVEKIAVGVRLVGLGLLLVCFSLMTTKRWKKQRGKQARQAVVASSTA